MLWDLAGISCHLNGLAIHEFKVALDDLPAILLAHVAILSCIKLKHIMRGRQLAIFHPVGTLLLLPLKLRAEVNIDKTHEFFSLAQKLRGTSIFRTKAPLCLLHSQDLSISKRPERKFLL